MDDVRTQYKTAQNLNTRISIHEKYSTNPQPFGDWIASQYRILPGAKVLELGCGTGDLWVKHLHLLKGGAALTLTDLSPGMLDAARAALPQQEAVCYQVVDIQKIPYPDGSFDVVIANMMLYHVPDLHRGLSEVRRVLKPGGTFYCATFGQHGIHAYVSELLKDLNVTVKLTDTFTLQNGEASLASHFDSVTRLDREDSLAITDPQDFADYILSLPGVYGRKDISRPVLVNRLEERMEHGTVLVPKEYGMFICR